jgi:PAS domain S-box-containing protein
MLFAASNASSFTFGTALTAIALVAQLQLSNVTGVLPFLLLYPAVIIVAWRGGFLPGIYATGLSAMAAAYFFLEPLGSIFLTEESALRLMFFVAMGVLLSCISHRTFVAQMKLNRARRHAEESEARLTMALMSGRMSIWEWDLQKRRIWRSEGHDRLFGLKHNSSGFVDDDFLRLVHPDDRSIVQTAVRDALAGRKPYVMEFRSIWSNGTEHWIMATGLVHRSKDGNPTKVLGCCVDITGTKRLERELTDALTSRDEFLSIASHELKTPLTSLNFQLQILQKRFSQSVSPPTNEVSEKISMALKQVRRIASLVDDLLDVARIRAKKMEMKPSEVNLAALVREVVARQKEEAQARGSVIVVNAPEEILGSWDPSRLEQVISNLVSNAIKYGNGSQIRIFAERRGERARLVVSDGGRGISAEDQKRIFERFERAVSSRHFGGLGLGLYIVRQIVEGHSGRISVQSEPGNGSTFTVELPLHAGVAAMVEDPHARAIRAV